MSDQTRVLQNLDNLFYFFTVFVSMYKNVNQRKETKKLIQEAKEEVAALEDKLYIVSRFPFKPGIIEIEKKQ